MVNFLRGLVSQRRFWQWTGQALGVAGVGLLIYFLGQNLAFNLDQLGLQPSFSFLQYQAGFAIGETVIPYRPTQSYWWALFVGFVNSLRVIGAGLVLATLLGLVAGIARLSSNWLLRQIALVYVELLRNMPLLLQLLFWYFGVFLSSTAAGQSFLGFALNQQGMTLPGGIHLSPEFSALWLGLSVYTGTFIAEIIRGGIQSVPKGQSEAAQSLGLTPTQTLWLVILPQALRSIVPPLGNQYLNLAKNSSLAIAVGYPDLYAVASTTYNQTGRALEVMLLLMVTYLSLSLIISLAMNLYNRSQLKHQ
ncbi:ABC transporter permease subunit [Candidatus Synechococcus calcipolaris G9]|uniref:ABC transporter permease subunit n=1 Tax=Candidatus Synechococcus calcipolaris G9 TaxID=1497997 RepID=A0ABT6F065_9SYNE|nr:ABC transporter permease subunit [Candidatus Synechococcus calcipolaris]MDG2991168.1 ABC transporter permease subunit [Candidatus Synechococcus calcipolaris G9]